MVNIKDLRVVAKGLSVLYVEDEEALRNSVLSYLRKIFTNVFAATNGLDGLKAYEKHSYNLVITDIQMPHMDGLEMISKIKSINPNQEIIITSAYSQQNYFLDAIRLGVSDYIIKPINREQMNQVFYKSASKLSRFKENIEYKLHLEEMVRERTYEVVTLENEKAETFEKIILAFVEMIEDRDTYTAGHSERVAKYSKLIAQKMGKSDEECELLYRAGILHDIGKIATPDTILLKPGKLNDFEYKLIQEHVIVGYDLLSKIPIYTEIAEIIKYHHERYDGKGYPSGVKGNEIAPLARIMIVADAFDAMTTNRIYKGRKDTQMAIKELQELSGIQFHPEIISSAILVFSEVDILSNISQLPKTEVEKERFSYFYRDQVTKAYNSDYLDYILNQNIFNKEYKCINALYLHSFSQYNNMYGWAEGDKLLNILVDYLCDQYPLSLNFRLHGDDFIIISKEHLEIDMNQFEDLEMFNKYNISISKHHIDITAESIKNLVELEALI